MPSLAILGSRPAPETSPNPGWSSRMRSRLDNPTVFLFVILTAQLMVVLDTTIVNVALPHIQEGLHLSGGDLSWVLNAYLLTFGGLLLLGARSGDLLGRRRTFLAGIAIFTLSSLFGGLAVTGWMLLSARALQGVGAALAAPSSLALLTTVFSDGPQRIRAIGLFTTVSAAGGAIGLVAGRRVDPAGVLALGDVRQRPHRAGGLGARAHGGAGDRASPRPLRYRRSAHVHPGHGRHRLRLGRGGRRRLVEPSLRRGSCVGRPPPRRILPHRDTRRRTDRALAAIRQRDPHRLERGAGTDLRRHVRDVLLRGAVPPGRPGLRTPADRAVLPADADRGVPLLTAGEQDFGRPGPARRL